MSVPQITPLPTPPSRRRPESFSDEADALLGALPAFQAEANALAQFVSEMSDEVAANAGESSGAVAAAQGHAEAAGGSAIAAGDSAGVALAQAGVAADRAGAADAAALAAEDSAIAAGAAAAAATSRSGEAAASANRAAAWADSDDEIDPGRRSAKYWADQAANSVADGMLDDTVTSPVKTWSSQRIADELGLSTATNIVRTNGVITSIFEVLPGGTRTTTLNYQSGVLAEVVQVHAGRRRTTTLNYTDGDLVSIDILETDDE